MTITKEYQAMEWNPRCAILGWTRCTYLPFMPGDDHPIGALKMSRLPRVCFHADWLTFGTVERPYADCAVSFNLSADLISSASASRRRQRAKPPASLICVRYLVNSRGDIVSRCIFFCGAFGSIFSANSNTVTNINLMGSNFIRQNIELFGGLTYSAVNSNTSYGLTVGGRYYFNPAQDKQMLPFAGVFYGYANGSSQATSNAFGLEGGVQYFVAPNVSVTPIVVWQSMHATGSTVDSFGMQFGLTYWFK